VSVIAVASLVAVVPAASPRVSVVIPASSDTLRDIRYIHLAGLRPFPPPYMMRASRSTQERLFVLRDMKYARAFPLMTGVGARVDASPRQLSSCRPSSETRRERKLTFQDLKQKISYEKNEAR
jgi:hypothetical protein